MIKVLKKLKTAFMYIRYLRIKAAIKLGKLFKDPVLACDYHRFNKCVHVDGLHCDYPECHLLINFQKRFETAHQAYKEIMEEGGAGKLWRDWKFYMFFVDKPYRLDALEKYANTEYRPASVQLAKDWAAENL